MNTEWLAALKPGDAVIVCRGYRGDRSLSKVVRLTATQVLVGESGERYRKKDGRAVAGDSWSRSWLKESTPELIKEINLERKWWMVRAAWDKWRPEDLTEAELDQILAIDAAIQARKAG